MKLRTALLSLMLLAAACGCPKGTHPGTQDDGCYPDDPPSMVTVLPRGALTVTTILPDWTPKAMQQKLQSVPAEDPVPCDCDYNQYWGELPPWLREGPGPFSSPYICTTPPVGTDSCMTFEWCGDPAIVPDWQWKNTDPTENTEMSKEKFGPDDEGHVYCLRYMKHSWRR